MSESDSCCHVPGHIESHHSEHHPESLNKNFIRVIASLLLAAISFVFGMPHLIGLIPSQATSATSAVAAIVLVLLFGRHFITSIVKLFRSSDMNTLVGVGILGAFGLSIWNLTHGVDHLYFDSAAFIAALVIVGQSIESFIRTKVNKHMSTLVGLLPQKARRIDQGTEALVALKDLKVGNKIRVLVGERVPVDCRVLSQSGNFDESILTGESKPVDKKSGGVAIQGALNIGQPIELEVIRISADSLYEQLVKTVNHSLSQRPPLQKNVDRFATFFVPAVIVIAVLTALFWKHRMPGSDIYIVTALSVLVIACPCALGMATPMALLVGVFRTSRKGILIKSLDAVERSSEIDLIAFDKTGTLTIGEPAVQRLKTIENISHRDLLQIALSVESTSEHPYAKAIQKKATEEKISVLKAKDLKVAPGKGVGGTVSREGKEAQVFVGNLVWLFENGFDSTRVPSDLLWDAEGTSETVLWVGIDHKIMGLIFLADQLRPGAREIVHEFQDEGYQCGMITGDADNVAKHFAKELNLKFYHAGVLPEEKATILKRLSAPKKKGMDMVTEEVAFIGDGVNDAPALATAKLGIAMGSGSALSQTTAGLILLSNDLKQLPVAFRALQDTRGLVLQNLILSFGYNIVAIPLAAGVLYPHFGILLNPGVAAGTMALSSITVLLNSLRALAKQ